jgi:hypothetical protein
VDQKAGAHARLFAVRDGPHGVALMPEHRCIVSRREVLKGAGGAALLPLACAFGLAGPPQSAQALNFESLDRAQARLLLGVARTLFPHDFLADQQYGKIVAALDAKAAADAGLAIKLKAVLHEFPNDFTAMEEAGREAYLASLVGSPIFDLIYKETLAGLYGDPMVSKLLGYEGSSMEYGGYLERGFDDISWLPSERSAVK